MAIGIQTSGPTRFSMSSVGPMLATASWMSRLVQLAVHPMVTLAKAAVAGAVTVVPTVLIGESAPAPTTGVDEEIVAPAAVYHVALTRGILDPLPETFCDPK